MQNIGMGRLKDIILPVPTPVVQEEIVEKLSQAQEKLHQVVSEIGRSIQLLGERRQALITTAVSGELVIPSQEVSA